MMLSKYLPGKQVLPCGQISAAGLAGGQLGPMCQQPEVQTAWQTGCKRRRLCLQASLSQRGAETGEMPMWTVLHCRSSACGVLTMSCLLHSAFRKDCSGTGNSKDGAAQQRQDGRRYPAAAQGAHVVQPAIQLLCQQAVSLAAWATITAFSFACRTASYLCISPIPDSTLQPSARSASAR